MLTNKEQTYPQFEVRDTGKYGKGVFASQFIPKGTGVHQMRGEIITFSECLDRIRAGKENQADSLQVGLELDMDLDEISNTFNHSCNPNTGLRYTSEMFAVRDIQLGEEITFDYSATIGPNVPASLWTMECKCGSSECRHVVGNVLTIPDEKLKQYEALGALQDYMIRELAYIKTNGGLLPKYRTYTI